jgi:hypothetical protein
MFLWMMADALFYHYAFILFWMAQAMNIIEHFVLF